MKAITIQNPDEILIGDGGFFVPVQVRKDLQTHKNALVTSHHLVSTLFTEASCR